MKLLSLISLVCHYTSAMACIGSMKMELGFFLNANSDDKIHVEFESEKVERGLGLALPLTDGQISAAGLRIAFTN